MPARPRAVVGLGSNPGLGGGFQLHLASRHAMRLNYTIQGSPVFFINCDRPLLSGIRAPQL